MQELAMAISSFEGEHGVVLKAMTLPWKMWDALEFEVACEAVARTAPMQTGLRRIVIFECEIGRGMQVCASCKQEVAK